MAEYIEREAFKDKYLCCGYLSEMSESEFDAFPSADVAPVVHSRWVRDVHGGIHCDHCKQRPSLLVKTEYCPNCGAKMDGDRHVE